jgi:mRNA degradation ribonuclease J1/J2
MYYGVHLCLPDHSLEQIAQGHEAHKERAKKTVVFGRNIVTCANLYDHFNMHIQQGDTESERLFAMFHRSTASSNKEHVLQ